MRRSLFPVCTVVRTAFAVGALGLPSALLAQGECTAPKSSNVARMLGWFASPLAFSQLGALSRLPSGAVVLGGDLTYVPTPSASITRTDVCYTSKSENTGLAPVLPRPRLTVGLGGGWSAEAMYLPPITVADATPSMGSVAVAWVGERSSMLRGAHLTVRAHATFGSVKGPITCPRSAIQQVSSTSVCWTSRPSEDTYRPNVKGVEVGLAASQQRLAWYGGVGYSSLMPRFQVGYTALNGTLDNTIVRVDLTRVNAFAGVGWQLSKVVELSAQLYSVPADATTGRAGLSWRLR